MKYKKFLIGIAGQVHYAKISKKFKSTFMTYNFLEIS